MRMKYVAALQRSDDAHVVVCEGDTRDEVIAAAQALYVALVPMILNLGHNVINSEARGGAKSDDVEHEVQQHAKDAMQHGWLVSEHLRAQEWGISVYEDKELVFWVGATRDDPDFT